MIQLQKKPAKHLISAYNQMMAVMRDAFEETHQEDMTLQKALDTAKHQTVHMGEVTAEEAYAIGEYIKRDINDAAEQMMESSAEFYDWLQLDIELIERKVMELFLSVADHTRIELEQFKQEESNDIQKLTYISGEVISPGTLMCKHCGKAKLLLSSSEISDCPACGNSQFIRRQPNGN